MKQNTAASRKRPALALQLAILTLFLERSLIWRRRLIQISAVHLIGMKFLALISGGKDSVFNILKCIENGHELVALGNLYPPEGKELDSYMYQSVGHEVIEQVAECLGKPLFRRPISGKPTDLTLEYSEAEHAADEVEDLFELIKTVLQQHPDIQGVSSGAIASTYQKNRVEHICNRLGLTSLAYLWDRDQPELLTEMVEKKMHSVLIKVACYGLDKQHLGKSLAEMKDYLLELAKSHGVYCCGEGGEFESLTLDCPVYGKRIELEEVEVVTHDLAAEVYYLKVKKSRVVDKAA